MSKRLRTKIMADDNRIRMCAIYEASHGLVRTADEADVVIRFAEFKARVVRDSKDPGIKDPLGDLEDMVYQKWSPLNRSRMDVAIDASPAEGQKIPND